MPRNMAMQDPLARIISAERDGHVSVSGEQNGVTTRGVVIFEGAVVDIVRMERPVFLREEDGVVAVKMHGMRDGDEDAFPNFLLVLGALGGHDDVDPFLFVEIFGHERIFGVVEGFVAQVVDKRVREIKPHGGVEDIPAREVTVRDGVFGGRDFDAYFEVVARVGVDWKAVSEFRVRWKGRGRVTHGCWQRGRRSLGRRVRDSHRVRRRRCGRIGSAWSLVGCRCRRDFRRSG